MPAVTNLTGTNAGPNLDTAPDITQLLIGDAWKTGVVTVTLSPATVAASTSAEQTFTVTGLLTGDFVWVNKPTTNPGGGIAGSRVSANNVLAITYINATAATYTPTTNELYIVLMMRPLPNTSNLLDF